MARGVDSAGQSGALEGGGESFAILGCGVDICYPRDAIGLYMDLQEKGGVISEFPIGTKPLPQHFPARNRIISGLADAVLVIEAKEKSGSLITADMALEQGKDVYALPGASNSTLSRGCHNLNRQGAGILLSPKDLLEELGIFYKNKLEKNIENKILLESPEKLVYSCLDLYPKSLNQILEESKLTISGLMMILINLEQKGYIKETTKNYYVKVK
jgi:DNA processing protein